MIREIREGLEGVVAASTRLSLVDGAAGRLVFAGYAAEEIAPRASFEEMAHLLWTGSLPSVAELETLTSALASRRRLPAATVFLMREAARHRTPAMDALRMAVSTLSLGRAENDQEDAWTLVAAFPAIIGGYWRLRQGLEPLDVRDDLSHAEHFLHQIFNVETSAGGVGRERARALETYLNTVSDHGFNASTFAARVIASTHSDLVSAITGAIGALKGPLHGGAPGPALEMVFEIGKPERAEAVILDKLKRGERLMGFGHRVYKVRDPRADILAAAAERFYTTEGDRELYQLALFVEKTALRLLAKERPGRPLHTNVEFYTALLLHGLGLPAELFTPTFAAGRVLGWSAHCLEQLHQGRLIRPESVYNGPTEQRFQALSQRAS
ncbi:MAG TPA: citrate synthase/methylcitrate synthase [Candidatus Angelobacter sp.]|nr:citrate synthase/methylcitrate synthase [Candidatus Angelobacter sp.]